MSAITNEIVIPGKTDHFLFNIHKSVIDNKSILYTIGEGPKYCLELVVQKPQFNSENKSLMNNFHLRMAQFSFMKDTSKRAHLDKIESLYECIASEMDPVIFDNYSFGTEILHFMIEYIKEHHTHIEDMSLSDKSQIMCNREINESMDLLTYSIALYGKTWYERTFSAFFEPNYSNSKYRNEVKYLRSTDFKNKISAEIILHLIYTYNPLALQIIKKEDIIKEFNSTATLPEFMIALNAKLKRSEKCRFYKTWLDTLVRGVVHNPVTNWIIPIKKSSIIGGSKRGLHVKTRKNKTSKF